MDTTQVIYTTNISAQIIKKKKTKIEGIINKSIRQGCEVQNTQHRKRKE